MTDKFTSRELVQNLQSGSLDALGELFDRHHQMVYRTALAITGDPEAASDLLQDVFLRMNRFADRIDVDRPLEPWLYRVTANLACTYIKRHRWLRPIDDIAEWLVGDNKAAPARLVEESETWGFLEKAIGQLPLSQRTVIVMYYVNGLAVQEISEVLEAPVGTIKSRLHYGRQSLRKLLNREKGVAPEVHYEFT